MVYSGMFAEIVKVPVYVSTTGLNTTARNVGVRQFAHIITLKGSVVNVMVRVFAHTTYKRQHVKNVSSHRIISVKYVRQSALSRVPEDIHFVIDVTLSPTRMSRYRVDLKWKSIMSPIISGLIVLDTISSTIRQLKADVAENVQTYSWIVWPTV